MGDQSSATDRWLAKAHGCADLWKPRHAIVTPPRGLRATAENTLDVPLEPLSPELVLVDPVLAERARAALPDRVWPPPRRPAPARAPTLDVPPPVAVPAEERHRAARTYPLWARVTAILWILVLGILIGGAAVPHAQDSPRVVTPEEDAIICERPARASGPSTPPLGPIGNPATP